MVRLSKNHFVNGNFATTADKIYEKTDVSCNSSGVGSATFTITDIPKDQQVWLNVYATTANRIVEVTGFTARLNR